MISLKLPKEEKDVIVRNVQAYFEEERSETIGALGAEQFIDFMIKELGPHIYNKAIADVRSIIHEKNNQLDDELYTLEKPITNRSR
ncbi:DUF2164 domain-containing protein [Cohnella cholangitidis]|uniref:DUF2164 domain-containing protein n=1 Tax=Cohnella cholangitidis TaxID=2598458 RepID=A0A7G5C6K4_9BACL|nr:DUF2164 domain-containing protein [Cohnella cholangitidis]